MSSRHLTDMWLMPVGVKGQRQGVFCEGSDQLCYLTSSHSLSMVPQLSERASMGH